MKNLRNKVKTKSFWMMLVAALILILRALGLELEQELTRICDAICGCLVSVGVLTSPLGESEKTVENLPAEDAQTQVATDE